MPNRPEYAAPSLLGRAAHGLLASAIGVGLLVAVVAAFESPLPARLAGSLTVSRAACAQVTASSAACRTTLQSTIVAAR